MATSGVSEKLVLAIRAHLLEVDAVPPTSAATLLAKQLTDVVMTKLSAAGLGREGLELLCTPERIRSKPNVLANDSSQIPVGSSGGS
jgi:hypothetical protein